MDVQTYLTNAVQASRQARLAQSDQLTLGKIIEKLEPIAARQKPDDEAEVYFDFEYLYPTSIDSWRGSYNELALNYEGFGYEKTKKPLTVSAFHELLKSTVGKTFEGYKGGEYEMDERTPVWVANWGNSGNTAVVGIVDADYQVLIITAYREF